MYIGEVPELKTGSSAFNRSVSVYTNDLGFEQLIKYVLHLFFSLFNLLTL